MKTAGASAVLLLALALAPTATAQTPANGLALTLPALDAPIPYMGSATVDATVQIGCLEIRPGGTVVVSSPQVPSWLTVAAEPVALEPEPACLTSMGTVTKTVPVTLTVTKDAPGVVPQSVDLVASTNGVSDTAALAFSVAYNADYELTADVRFPLDVTGPTATFNLTVTQRSNARSMVMMENKSESAGTLSGLASTVYEADSLTKVFPITYKAPTGAWTNATVSFKAYSHWLLPEGSGDFTAEKAVTWTFRNAGPAAEDEPESGGKESPAPVAPMLALGLLALAALARRR